MERSLNIFGKPTTFSNRDEDIYLKGLPDNYETDTLSIFNAICLPHFNALDIGANIGITTVALGRLCSEGRVLAIEPSPVTYQYLNGNISKSNLTNISTFNVAAAREMGQLEMSYWSTSSTGGFINHAFKPENENYLHVQVSAQTIDSIVESEQLTHLDFIKIDTEGYELEALHGARQTIEKFKPIVFCEVNHWCLNIFHRIPLPSFIEQLNAYFPHLFAIDSSGKYLDLSDPSALYWFYYEHTMHFRYINLLCGFDKKDLLQALISLEGQINSLSERNQLRTELEMLREERDQIKAEKSAIQNSRSYRLAKQLARLKRLLKPRISRIDA